jgi:hypothetical protein
MDNFFYNLKNKYIFLICTIFFLSQLLTVRFFFTSKYIIYDRFFIWLFYVFFSTLIFFIILKKKEILKIITSKYVFYFFLLIFLVFLLILYPIADAQKINKMGIDQDDCIINFIENLKQNKFPYNLTYLGNPCSTGIMELLFYFPVLLWKNYFSIIPAISLIIFYYLVKIFTNHINAVLFTLFQLGNLLFLEMSSAGSDFILIAISYPFGLFLAYKGFQDSKKYLLFISLFFLCFFYGSRVILFFLLPVNLFLFYIKFGSKVFKLFLAIFLLVFLSYFIPWLINPKMFTPFHILEKGIHLLYFVKFYLLTFFVILFLISRKINFPKIIFIHKKNNFFALNIFFYVIPIFFVCFADLIENKMLSKWEGLNYFLLIIPSIYLLINLYLSKLFIINKNSITNLYY